MIVFLIITFFGLQILGAYFIFRGLKSEEKSSILFFLFGIAIFLLSSAQIYKALLRV